MIAYDSSNYVFFRVIFERVTRFWGVYIKVWYLPWLYHCAMLPCDPGIPPAQPQAQAPPPTSSAQSLRPLQREGAMIFLNNHEQELHDAMMRSSPPPELSILGKRPRQEGHPPDAGDTDVEDDGPSPMQSQAITPTFSNVAAACLRHASKKKLRADQCNDLEVFLVVSPSLIYS